jgi:two-component system chemotaxis sensor kinase CheA
LRLTGDGIADLASHPGLDLLEEGLSERAAEAETGWQVIAFSFRLAEDFLTQTLEADPGQRWFRAGITDMVEEAAAAVEAGADEATEEALFGLRRAEAELQGAVITLETFVADSLDGLGDRIGAAADVVVQQTVRISAVAIGLLVLFVIAALLLGIRFLDQAVRGLETVVQRRTRAVQSLLDFSGQGFLSFGPDLIVRPEYSRECETIFGQSIAGKYVPALIYPKGQAREDFEQAMQLVFSKQSRPDVVFDLLDHEVDVEGRTIHLDFRLIDDETIMLSLQDVSQQKGLQQQVYAEQEVREMILRAAMNRISFVALTHEAEDVFRAAHSMARDTEEDANQHLMRIVHTFKANAAYLKMNKTVQAAHALEERIEERLILGQELSIAAAVDALVNAYQDEIEQIRSFLGDEWSQAPDTLVVKERHVRRLENLVRDRYANDEMLVEIVEDMRRVPVGDLLRRAGESVQILADSRAKRLKPVHIEGGNVLVHYEDFAPVGDAILHLMRNMVDHGIEYPPERERAGKNTEGEIRISVQESPSHLEIKVSDDGSGIKLDAVEAKARRMGLINGNASQKELIKLLFRDGFSTAESVSEVSGRGVGLSAVRANIRELGGTIGVSTKPGQGTTFTLKVGRKRER